MSKLRFYLSEEDFTKYILGNLTHKTNHNRLKVSYYYIFNEILYVLKSGCSWRALRPTDNSVTWQNIYYHYNKWSKDGSFEKLFSSSLKVVREDLALECIQLDGSHTVSKKGGKMLSGKEEKEHKQSII
jgi:hypothetical protein